MIWMKKQLEFRIQSNCHHHDKLKNYLIDKYIKRAKNLRNMWKAEQWAKKINCLNEGSFS